MWLWVSITKFKTIKKVFVMILFVKLKIFSRTKSTFCRINQSFSKIKATFCRTKKRFKSPMTFFRWYDFASFFYYHGTNIFCCVLSGTESNFFPQKQNPIFGGKRMKTIPFISGLTSFGQNYFLFDFLIVTKMSPK